MLKRIAATIISLSILTTASITPIAASAEEEIVESGTSPVMELDLSDSEAEILDDSTDSIDYNEYSADYYYKQLDDSNKVSYNTIYESMKTPNIDKIVIDTSSADEYVTVSSRYSQNWTDDEKSEISQLSMKVFSSGFTAMMLDHPEIFWIDQNNLKYSYSYGFRRTSFFSQTYDLYITRITLSPAYAYNYTGGDDTNAQENVEKAYSEFNDIVDNKTAEFQAEYTSDADRLWAIYNYIGNTASYSTSSTYDTSSAGSVLLEPHLTVCEGYTHAIKIFCDKLGIPCLVIGGNYNASNNTGHAWNYVKLNEKWYGLDITWDDRDQNGSGLEVTNTYFLKGSNFSKSHTPGKVYKFIEFNYPILASNDYYSTAITTTTAQTTTTTILTTSSVPATTSITDTSTIQETIKYGDVDLNNQNTISDVVMINRYLAGSIELNEKELSAANVYMPSSSKVDSDDVQTLLKYLVGIISLLPVE